MVDIKKHIQHWRNGAVEDFAVARELLETGRVRHALFFAHLALEKMLKAIVCFKTNDLAPPLHNLIRLAEKCELRLNNTQTDFLAEMNEFNIEGRYPELSLPEIDLDEANNYLNKTGETIEWLKNQLLPQ